MENIHVSYLKNCCPPFRVTWVERFVEFAIIWGVISSCVVLLLIEKGITTPSIFALKDIPLYLGALLFANNLLQKQGSRIAVLLLFLALVFLYFNYEVLNPSYNAPVNNIRQLIAPLVVLLVFTHLTIPEDGANRVLRLLCWAVLFVFGFGVFEQVIELWPSFNLNAFFRLKGIPTNEEGVSYMFYEPMFGYRERMTSTFLDPVSLGHFFASAGILLFYIKAKTRFQKLVFICCLAGMFLALSKGAILQFFLGIIFLNRKIPYLIKLLMALVPFIVLAHFDSPKGLLIHISGLFNSLKSLTLFGYGIGSVGNYAKMFSGNLTIYYKLGISDTYVGALLGQIGILGTIMWFLIGVQILVSAGQKKEVLRIATNILLSILAVSILSENTMNVTSFVLPAIIAGLSIQLSVNSSRNSVDLEEFDPAIK